MANQQQSEFETLLFRKKDKVGVSVLLILAWISTSDGALDEEEKKNLWGIAEAGNHSECMPLIISLAKRADIAAIQLACEIIKAHFTGERSGLFMEVAIGISIADRFLLPSENYILRFLADLLGITKSRLNGLFLKATGKPLPDPPNVSSQQYWQQKQDAQQRSKEDRSSTSDRTARHSSHHVDAHSTLGLAPGASKEEIKAAFRKLAHEHHPDRFHALGEEAVAAATITFTRINNAYNQLIRYA